MKKDVLTVVLLVVCLVSISFVSASFQNGTNSHDIDDFYGPGEVLSGWLNISLEDEPADTLLKGFSNSIKLLDFLKNTRASYTCTPLDCSSYYPKLGSSSTSRNLFVVYENPKIIGINLGGQVNQVTSLEFKIKSDLEDSCFEPLKIDVLDDDISEWKADELSGVYNCEMRNPYGCYKDSDQMGTFLITDKKACQKIKLTTASRGFLLGADIIKVGTSSGDTDVNFEITAGDNFKQCIAKVRSTGKVSCLVEFDKGLTEPIDANVCVSVNQLAIGEYELKYEDVDACGSYENEKRDFSIFVKGGKYKGVGTTNFNSDLVGDSIDLGNYITNYVDKRYQGDCESGGCIIPISIYSWDGQEIVVSDLKLVYRGNVESAIYEVERNVSIVDANYQKLDLEKAGILAPLEIGNHTFDLKLGNKRIFKQNITVSPVPTIKDIYPKDPATFVETNFFILLQNPAENLTYDWSFGDGSKKQTTTKNFITHTYEKIGNYDLTVAVSNNYGSNSKKFEINVKSPRDLINNTIDRKWDNIDDVESQISGLPNDVINYVLNTSDWSDLRSELEKLEQESKGIVSDDKAMSIMGDLFNLEIPFSFGISQTVTPTTFFQSAEQIDFGTLEDLGAGKTNATRDQYNLAVNSWLLGNMEITLEYETYSFYYETGEEKPVVSNVEITFKPRRNISNFYLVINGDSAKIIIKNKSSQDIGRVAKGITFPKIGETFKINLLYPGKVDFFNLPFYVSPNIDNLDVGVVVTCNRNNICEKDLGESIENCKYDCKPVGITITLMFILIAIAFVVYIVLQEWYKRYYEHHLFPNRSDLFNVINFINNALNQGLKKPGIFKQLSNQGWKNEQIIYVWKKYQGKRTGMFEIPIFKGLEKIKMQKEIAKRQIFQRPGFSFKYIPKKR